MIEMNEHFWRGVALMAAEVLQGDELPDANIMLSAMTEELRRRKFALPLTGRRLVALANQIAVEAFENSVGAYSLKHMVFLCRIARSFDAPGEGMVLGRIVLLYWLFGGWMALKERCHWLSVMGSESDLSTQIAVSARSKLEAQFRRTCAAFIRKNPECSRLDFQRAEYRSFRWLLHYDKAWLDRQLPIPYRGGKQLLLF